MAVPVPTTDIVIPTDWVERGPNLLSPSTKSSASVPVVYCQPDQCEAFNYVIGTRSVTINEQIDCRPVLQATGTLSLRAPEGITVTDLEQLIDFLKDDLVVAMSNQVCT